MKPENTPLEERPVLPGPTVSRKRFEEKEALHHLKHYLPAQAPLKDFIHHNTLHAFQHYPFQRALKNASAVFGYKVLLSLEEYRSLYQAKRIREDVLKKLIAERKGASLVNEWMDKLLHKTYAYSCNPRIGALRSQWKKIYGIDLDARVHPILFRVLCSYLDQGISIWNFPLGHGLLSSVLEMEQKSFTSFFKTTRVRKLLLSNQCEISYLLKILVGDESLYEQYLYDQQFSHPGWSGMVSAVEDMPHTLLDRKKISLKDLIAFELLLEIDALDFQYGEKWKPLATRLTERPAELFAEAPYSELDEVLYLMHEAFEWTYYDGVLAGIKAQHPEKKTTDGKKFQAMFCLDDRECSLRRYLEKLEPGCETYGTPGFFSVEFYFQPHQGKFYTKQCPAPVTPGFLIKEQGIKQRREKAAPFLKYHGLLLGWLFAQTVGFWCALKLFLNIFRPSLSPSAASSFKHMSPLSSLTIENKDPDYREKNLQIGFTPEEMATRIEALLRSIGLIKDFAPLVYVTGHGSTSVNNPHYAAYDCGACSGRPGSVNARVAAFMANHPKVRAILETKGIYIPSGTQFVGGLHDTTCDEVYFYDEDVLTAENFILHMENKKTFTKALDLNSKERSRRFESISTMQHPEKIHAKIRQRAVSLFETRPELNHATNALCIIGRRDLSDGLFLDRRAFLNSYDYQTDPDGVFLLPVLKAAAPVCGGINLEYFFSRVDNQKLGAGTKLPHNVMGLFGVANGIEGDLRPGLPSQMIEVHDPVRLLMVVEHFPEVILKVIQSSPETYEWFKNQWVHLVAVHPATRIQYIFRDEIFTEYSCLQEKIDAIPDLPALIEQSKENIPVHLFS